MIASLSLRPAGTDASPLIPARMLNEFCYCPRLGYLEWVEGEFADNLDTLEGTFSHRNVDRGDRKQIPSPADETPKVEVEKLHARSVHLSAPNEGLVAMIDLLELDGQTVTPVDYKKGKAPDLPEGAWEPERVQLCAQGLILREAGYQCDRGVIYYVASKKRVTIEFDDALIDRTRQLVQEFRKAAEGPIPPPLVDSPKCPRCSLVGICLPDETHRLQTGLPTDDVRRLIPASDDALPLYVQEQGAYVGKSGELIQVRKDGNVLADAKILHTSQVCLFGNVQISTQLVRELVDRGIPVCYYTYGGWFSALTAGMPHNNIELRRQQFALAEDAERSLPIARALIEGKIRNCRTLLRRNLSDDAQDVLAPLAEYSKSAASAHSAERLLGIEGMAAKVYFGGLARTVKEGLGFSLEGRNRRPPTDPVNALLSFAYALLLKDCTAVLYSVGFDPMLGIYHRPRFGRPSLALDFAEPFRPLIADSLVLTVINNQEVRPDDFLHRAGAVALTPAARKTVLSAYERRMQSLVTHPLFGYRVSYRRILEVQARLLARCFVGEIPAFPPFETR